MTTEAGERIPYDALVLATGSVNRMLPMFPAGQPGIYYLRTEAEALALKAHLASRKSLILIGGGVVGLEIAASAAELGIKVTVIEIAPRILARVCDEETSAIIHAAPPRARRRHPRSARSAPACRRCRTAGSRSTTKAGETHRRRSHRGRRRRRARRSRSRKAAGLAVQDGILVDDRGRTSDPAIFAAGDCTRFAGPNGPVRLENWRHAQEHGAVAGRNAAGGDAAYNTVPSYWSEQYDLYIQGMGWPVAQPSARVRRKISDKATLLFELDGAQHRLCDRHQCAARHRDRPPADRAAHRGRCGELADPAKPLNAMLKRRPSCNRHGRADSPSTLACKEDVDARQARA